MTRVVLDVGQGGLGVVGTQQSRLNPRRDSVPGCIRIRDRVSSFMNWLGSWVLKFWVLGVRRSAGQAMFGGVPPSEVGYLFKGQPSSCRSHSEAHTLSPTPPKPYL